MDDGGIGGRGIIYCEGLLGRKGCGTLIRTNEDREILQRAWSIILITSHSISSNSAVTPMCNTMVYYQHYIYISIVYRKALNDAMMRGRFRFSGRPPDHLVRLCPFLVFLDLWIFIPPQLPSVSPIRLSSPRLGASALGSRITSSTRHRQISRRLSPVHHVNKYELIL